MEAGKKQIRLQVDIQKHKQFRYISFYTIELRSDTGHEWSIDKRYNDFYHLNEALEAKFFASLPPLPPKTFFPVRNQDQL